MGVVAIVFKDFVFFFFFFLIMEFNFGMGIDYFGGDWF